MTTSLLSDARRSPAKGGEISFQLNGQPASFPARSYDKGLDTILDFSEGDPNNGTWRGMLFYVKTVCLDKEVSVPGKDAHFQATIDGEHFLPGKGTIWISEDADARTYSGTLSVQTLSQDGKEIFFDSGVFVLEY